MALAAVGGFNVIRAELNLPRHGVWNADVEVDAVTPFAAGSHQSMSFGTFAGTATVLRSDVFRNTVYARMVGGSGGLSNQVTPKGYFSVPLSTPLNDLLAIAGETLNAQSSSTILSTALNSWGTVAGTVGLNLSNLWLKVPAPPYTVWRIMLDGSFWIGTDNFPPLAPSDVSVLRYDAHLNKAEFAETAPAVLPGYSYLGSNIDRVRYHINGERTRGMMMFLP